MIDKMTDMINRAIINYASKTPEQQRAADFEQRRSFCRAEAGFGSDRDETEYSTALASKDPALIATCEAKAQARLTAFDAYWEKKYG